MKSNKNLILLMVLTILSSLLATYLIDYYVEEVEKRTRLYLIPEDSESPFKNLPTLGFRSVNEGFMRKGTAVVADETMRQEETLFVPMRKQTNASIHKEAIHVQAHQEVESYSSMAPTATHNMQAGNIIVHNFIAMSAISSGVPRTSMAYLATVPAKRNLNIGPPVLPDPEEPLPPDHQIGNVPIGDSIGVLYFCLMGYILCLTYRRKKA